MNPRNLRFGVLTVLAALAPPAAPTVPAHSSTLRAPAASGHPLHAFGSRSAQQRRSVAGMKLDAALAELTRHTGQIRAAHAIEDLHAMSPAARFVQHSGDAEPLVLVDAVTRGDPAVLKKSLQGLGMRRASVYSNDVSGWLPVSQLETAAAQSAIHAIRASLPRTRAGAVITQGDHAQRSDVLRATYPTLSGSGVTVGALSDSFNCYPVYAANGVPAAGFAGYASNGFTATFSQDVSSADLPAGVKVVQEASCLNYGAPTQLPFGDEGRAMLQIVHDVAPGANLAFYTAENGEADFANGIGALASAGAAVIADDVGYFDEPFFQDGLVAQAIDAVAAQGVACFSSAGNEGSNGYDNLAPVFATAGTGPTVGELLLNFDTTGATHTTSFSVSVPAMDPGELVAVVLQWDQPYVTGASNSPGASSHLDLCVAGATGLDQVVGLDGNSTVCTGPNATGQDPVQVLILANPANSSGPSAAENVTLIVGLADGTAPPGRIKLVVEDNGLGATLPAAVATNSATVQGHPGATGAAAVGAAFFFDTPRCGAAAAVAESYSSQGGTPILFDLSGARLATPVLRQKPDFVAPDGGNDTFLGFAISSGHLDTSDPACQNDVSYPNFFGTSAAAPHAAAIAALMLQANSVLTPAEIYTALRTSALPMGTMTPDDTNGYGLIQADAALATLPPGPPVLTLGSTSVNVGATTTLQWTSINATECTASGAWSGSQQRAGSVTITAAATTGTQSYTLTCGNSHGSAAATAKLTVAAASHSSGGGGVDPTTLFSLSGLALVAACRRLARRAGRTRSATL